jgi:hypothetical protein
MLPAIASRYGVKVIELPSRIDIPRLLQGLKGASARIANRDKIVPRGRLQWADGYDLRSLGVRDLHRAIQYVRTQSMRHPELAVDDVRVAAP